MVVCCVEREREAKTQKKERKRSDIFLLPSSHLAHSLPSAHTMPQNISLVPTALIDLGNKSKEGATVDECFFCHQAIRSGAVFIWWRGFLPLVGWPVEDGLASRSMTHAGT